MRAVLFLVVLALASGAALADFAGGVVKVADGDTLTVLINKKQIRVRLDGIDAPSAARPLGSARSSRWRSCVRRKRPM
jgi:endonuclease YncB( thermonuclease family)